MKNTNNVNRSGRQVKCPVCGTVFGIRPDGLCYFHSVMFKRWLIDHATGHTGTIEQFIEYWEQVPAIVAITSR